MDRYLPRGRTLKYRGRLVAATGQAPAHVDTTAKGSRLEIVFVAVEVRWLAELTIGRRVLFDRLIEPRALWMKRLAKERSYQTWMLVVTLPSGETVDIGDRFVSVEQLEILSDEPAERVRP